MSDKTPAGVLPFLLFCPFSLPWKLTYHIPIDGSSVVQSQFIKALYIETEASFLGSQESNAVANSFSMGYSFIEYKDDFNELLCTLEIYTLPGSYNENYLQVIRNFSKKYEDDDNIDNLLVVNLLDYNNSPQGWLRETQIWFDVLQRELKDSRTSGIHYLNQLTVVVNRSAFVEIEPEVHEFMQASVRVQAMKLNTSVLYVPSFSNTSSTIKTSRSNCIKCVSHLLQLHTTRSVKPIESKSNFVDISQLVALQGQDDLNKIHVLYSAVQDLYDNYTVDSSDENETILNYENTVGPAFEDFQNEINRKDVGLKPVTVIEKPKDLSYQDFLESVYKNRTKEPTEIIAHVLKDL